MAQQTMYPGMINSPITTITNNINASDTIIYVLDDTKIPEPPNLLVLGGSLQSAETVLLTAKDGSMLTVQRGLQGTPIAWNAGATIARNFTEYDYRKLKENIEDLAASTGDIETLETDDKTNLVASVNEVNEQIENLDFYLKQIGKYGIKNLVKNGDFVDGTTGWILWGNAAIAEPFFTINDGKLLLNGQSPGNGRLEQDIISNATDKFYLGYDANGTGTVSFQIADYGTFNNASAISTSNTEVGKSSVIFNGRTTGFRFSIGYPNGATYVSKTIDSVLIINLTQIFGVGNEPTKEVMDAILEYYPYLLKFLGATFIDLTGNLLNGWERETTSFPGLLLTKNDGMLNIIGSIKNGTITKGTIIAEIPTGYKAIDIRIPAYEFGNPLVIRMLRLNGGESIRIDGNYDWVSGKVYMICATVPLSGA